MIDIAFEGLADVEKRNYFLSLLTSFALTSEQIQALLDVGPQLLEESPEFQALLDSLSTP